MGNFGGKIPLEISGCEFFFLIRFSFSLFSHQPNMGLKLLLL